MPMNNTKLIIRPPVIAHRGAKSIAPENTLTAFRKAKELGINWVEFDVMLSADNEVVVIHDDTLDRTTNGKGPVIGYPYSYLKTLDAGSWFDPKFKGEKIPTLVEVIELLNQLQISANVEIKAQKGKEEITVKNVLKIIQENWKNTNSQALISSFSLSILEWVRHYSSTSLIGFLMHEWNPSWKSICDQLQCVAVDVNYKILNEQKVKQIKETDRMLLAYTVNNSKQAKTLFFWGVDAVFSDNPDRILEYQK